MHSLWGCFSTRLVSAHPPSVLLSSHLFGNSLGRLACCITSSSCTCSNGWRHLQLAVSAIAAAAAACLRVAAACGAAGGVSVSAAAGSSTDLSAAAAGAECMRVQTAAASCGAVAALYAAAVVMVRRMPLCQKRRAVRDCGKAAPACNNRPTAAGAQC